MPGYTTDPSQNTLPWPPPQGPQPKPWGGTSVPVSYPNPRIVQKISNLGDRYIPTYQYVTVATPVYPPMVIEGPGQEYTRQKNAFGLVNMKIVFCRIGGKYTPTYVPVIVNDLTYKIQPFVVVSVPRCVYDTINQSLDFGANIVP